MVFKLSSSSEIFTLIWSEFKEELVFEYEEYFPGIQFYILKQVTRGIVTWPSNDLEELKKPSSVWD